MGSFVGHIARIVRSGDRRRRQLRDGDVVREAVEALGPERDGNVLCANTFQNPMTALETARGWGGME